MTPDGVISFGTSCDLAHGVGMELLEAFAAFDGKHVEPLKNAAGAVSNGDADALVDACVGVNAVAATWIVKSLLKNDKAAGLDMHRVFAALGQSDGWEPVLHLLQSVQFAPDAAVAEVFAIRKLLAHSKTLVRVWALDAFVRVAIVEPEFLSEARALVTDALNGKAASLRARARALVGVLGMKAS